MAMASVLLCGILSDTLVLKSATTTDLDKETAEYLASITDLSIEELGHDIMASASEAARLPAEAMVRVDRKEYESEGKKLSVSQIELMSTLQIMDRAGNSHRIWPPAGRDRQLSGGPHGYGHK
jgi:manganese-dependent inorganic pyrophosphatase